MVGPLRSGVGEVALLRVVTEHGRCRVKNSRSLDIVSASNLAPSGVLPDWRRFSANPNRLRCAL